MATGNCATPQGDYFGPLVFPQVNVQTPSAYLTLQADPGSPANTSQVRIYARAEGLPRFRALRLLLNGVPVAQTSATELYYTWNTAGYSAIGHSLVAEAATWTDLTWSRPERRGLVYLLQGTASGPNFAPDRPALTSPADWHSAISAALPLCAQGGDANGDALLYQYEITGAAGTSTSGWVSGCHTPGSLAAGAYTWRARGKDPAGAISLWSSTRHFSLASGSAGITQFGATPLNSDQIRVPVCTALTAPVTLSVRANTAADSTGQWAIVGEVTGTCATNGAALVWDTLPYSDGAHLLRVIAHTAAGAVLSDTVVTLGARRPAAPNLLAPLPDTGTSSDPVYLNERPVTFQWETAARAEGYTLLISTSPNPEGDTSPVLRQIFDSQTLSYTLALPTGYSTLYWQVLAANASGSSASGVQPLSLDQQGPTCLLQSAQTSGNTWQVSWAGQDDLSGVAAFHLRYRVAGNAEWFDWLINLPGVDDTATFTGLAGNTYSFWCQAVDQAGNLSDRKVFLPMVMR